jgi:glycosyltransferase involved in cell wall biosynthesis
MTNTLTISVVIITRNRAAWLTEALASLTGQTRSPDEVVVVDNDSKDNTKAAILSFKDKLKIKYVFESKHGIPYARNAGILNASGNILAFIDDDCAADVNWLKNLEIPFIKDPNIGAVGGEISYQQLGNDKLEKFYMDNMIIRTGKRK